MPEPLTLPREAQGALAAAQAAFARALLEPGATPPAGLAGPDGEPSLRRFSIYRNNVVVGWIDALQAAYPVTRRLVGDAFFAAMARDHAMQSPPATPVMLDYGGGFPDFVARFAPASGLPYLADVARLERAWIEAYHAADAAPIAAADLAGISPAVFPASRLCLHPSVRVLRSAHPIAALWHAHVGGGDVTEIDLGAGADDVLVTRPEAEVEIRRLPTGAAAFIAAVQGGATVLEAMEAGDADSAQFDLASTLAGLIEASAVTALVPQPEDAS